ncbi:unnamed protein product [Vicia faba]|uniref:Uncharacterized protein n=1 Tax=Vicia faba TaxID=3906 RepID=A0AAV0ZNM3_VICFA|nr:unnamed protein product [Vicia faba]
MDQSQNQRSLTTPPPPSRSVQFHPTRVPILDLLTLLRTRKKQELPPPNEQFILDFEQFQSQFPDHEQLRFVVKAVLIPLVAQCSGHGSRSDFLIFIFRSLSGIWCINWDAFLPSLLSSVSSAELPVDQMSQAVSTITSSSLSQSGMLPPLNTITNSSNF